ncbi:hypothetical protein [Hufsiella ginkgonis]|uniref:Uncharacterized protein n=1 Tax=Hufsiella ginkgonis TaxID=2695274 RepID=A0A7K1Y034_9SPHI|nr:hypothetical protein [Hufsiella ginkgonis]MXV16580.1 hypothetical protein [Hufsiella ginkgonis]
MNKLEPASIGAVCIAHSPPYNLVDAFIEIVPGRRFRQLAGFTSGQQMQKRNITPYGNPEKEQAAPGYCNNDTGKDQGVK